MYDFKKYFIWCSWLTVNLFVCYYSFLYLTFALELIYFDIYGCYWLGFIADKFFFLNLEIPYSLCAVGFFLISRLLSDFSLYIYSYKLYFGKKNWYKFFREREIRQKKQNSQDWKNYCKSLKG